MGKFDRYGNIDKEQDSNHDSQEVLEEMAVYDIYQTDQNQDDPAPIAAFDPSTGHVKFMERSKISQGDYQIWDPTTAIIQYKALQLSLPEEGNSKGVHSEVTTDNINTKGLEEFGTIPEDQILVHGNSGPYLMNKDKCPDMSLSAEKNWYSMRRYT